jgi:hypothetical protein
MIDTYQTILDRDGVVVLVKEKPTSASTVILPLHEFARLQEAEAMIQAIRERTVEICMTEEP